jgi:hypothetical protein
MSTDPGGFIRAPLGRLWKTQPICAKISLLPQFWTGLMGGKQLGFSDYELTTAKKQTKRERFLSEMEEVDPWQALIDFIEPHHPKTSRKSAQLLRNHRHAMPVRRSHLPS